MSSRRAVATALLALALLVPQIQPVGAQTSADLFDDGTLQEVRLFVNSKDLARLRAGYLDNTYYPADLQWRNTRVRNVAVRPRGTGSRNSFKLGLRVDIDYYTSGQRFVGLKSLVLDNLWQDPSLLREALAMKVFRRMGQPAPREAFCRLFINNAFQGLYAVVEEITSDFAARETGEADGYVYEYHYRFPFYGEFLGTDLAIYKPIFEPRSHELESDEQLYGPIRDLFREINQPDDAVWLDLVAARLDLEQFLSHLGIEVYLAENDGILGYAGINNFYLYRSATTNKHRIFPWDRDNAFTFLTSSVLRSLDENIIFRRTYDRPELRTHYLNVVEQTARMAAEENWLENEINRLLTVIDAAARQDTLKQYSNAQFDEGIAQLIEFARTRSAFLIEEISRLR